MTWIPNLRNRAALPERMDDPNCDARKLARTIRQFRTTNRLFSRYRMVLRRHVLADMRRDADQPYHLVDVGAGGAEIAAWLLREAEQAGLHLRITAIDADPRTVGFAIERYGRIPGLEIRCLDAFTVESLEPIDYLYANHFLHHLADEDIVRFMRLAGDRVRRRAILSDLTRGYLWYYGFGATAALLFHGSFTREDGLTSIRRGFTAAELQARVVEAGLAERTRIETCFPGRLNCIVSS